MDDSGIDTADCNTSADDLKCLLTQLATDIENGLAARDSDGFVERLLRLPKGDTLTEVFQVEYAQVTAPLTVSATLIHAECVDVLLTTPNQQLLTRIWRRLEFGDDL